MKWESVEELLPTSFCLYLLAQLLIQSIFNLKHASANNLFEILFILKRCGALNITDSSQIEFSG